MFFSLYSNNFNNILFGKILKNVFENEHIIINHRGSINNNILGKYYTYYILYKPIYYVLLLYTFFIISVNKINCHSDKSVESSFDLKYKIGYPDNILYTCDLHHPYYKGTRGFHNAIPNSPYVLLILKRI